MPPLPNLGKTLMRGLDAYHFVRPSPLMYFRDEEIEQLRAEKARLETELREARDTIKGKDETAAKERAAMIQRFID